MGDFTSYSYDLLHFEKDLLTAKCVVHFRPGTDWNGTQYGFDWMRLGESVTPWGDLDPYSSIVKKQYKTDKPDELETDINKYEGKYKSDPGLYRKLEEDYHPLLTVCKNNKRYYCSWLSLFPSTYGAYGWYGTTQPRTPPVGTLLNRVAPSTPTGHQNTVATLRLFVDVEVAPEYLIFEEHEAFEISPMRIDSIKGKPKGVHKLSDIITIKRLKHFYEDQKINIYAIQKNPDGTEDRKLAGRLWVWASAIRRPKILFVEVTTPPIPPRLSSRESEQQSMRRAKRGAKLDSSGLELLKKYLRQSLVELQIDPTVFSLDLSRDTVFRENYIVYTLYSPDNSGHIKRDKKNSVIPMAQYLNDALSGLFTRLRNDKNVNDYIVVYLFGVRGDSGGYASGKTIVAYNALTASGVAHEILHCLGLPHTFSNAECEHGQNIKPPKCTYEALQTENIMDYTEPRLGISAYATWHWQWVIANSGA
jgi:hypothetical protein